MTRKPTAGRHVEAGASKTSVCCRRWAGDSFVALPRCLEIGPARVSIAAWPPVTLVHCAAPARGLTQGTRSWHMSGAPRPRPPRPNSLSPPPHPQCFTKKIKQTFLRAFSPQNHNASQTNHWHVDLSQQNRFVPGTARKFVNLSSWNEPVGSRLLILDL